MPEDAGKDTVNQNRSSGGGAFDKPIKVFLAPILIPLRFLAKILPWILVMAAIILLILFVLGKVRTGQASSTVTHAQVAGEENLNFAARLFRPYAPTICAALDPRCASQYNPYAIESAVETNANNRDIGVKVTEFKPIGFFRPNSDIKLIGKIKARGLDQPSNIEVYCSLEGYRGDAIIPAELLGTTAIGNTGTIFQDQTTEFTATCNFPGGVPATQQITTKIASLIVLYNFKSKAYERLWFLDRPVLLDLESNGINPFDQYAVKDPLLDSDRKITSKATPGPINLGLQVDFPQPLTVSSKYLLMAKLSRTLEAGNLQKLDSLKIQVPSTGDLDVVLASEQNLGPGSSCDFEYLGETADGYKEYRLLDLKLSETNQQCDKKTLRDLALSESDCISIFKEPTFTCNFLATRVPQSLQSDVIKAEATYTYEVKKKAAVDIRALPGEVGATVA